MFPLLKDEQRQAIEGHSTPLPFVDELTTNIYILLSVKFVSDRDQSGFTAHRPMDTMPASLNLAGALKEHREYSATIYSIAQGVA